MAMLQHSKFTCSECFSGCLQPDLFYAKSANVESFSTSGACIRGNSIGDAYARGASVINAYIKSNFVEGACAGKAQIGDTGIGDTYAKIAISI